MFSAFDNKLANLSFRDTHDDERTLRFLRSQVDTFKKYLMKNYPNDPRTKTMLAKLTDVQLLPYRKGSTSDSYNSGMFNHQTGVLHIAPRDGNGVLRTAESLNKSICHELGHATRWKYIGESSHSDEWSDAWKFFLKIATRELMWKVEAPCSVSTFYGLKYEDCENCLWEMDVNSCPKGKKLS